MNQYTVEVVDNGWMVGWWDEASEGDEMIKHTRVFQVPDEWPDNEKDHDALMEFLYFLKEEVAGVYYSKHKQRNCMIRMEGGEDGEEIPA